MEDRIIYFNEAEHKYTDEFNNPYISVTTLISNYYEKFDVKAMAHNCAMAGMKGNPKYIGKTAKQLETEWDKTRDDACEKGTERHNYLEQIVKNSTNYKMTIGTSFINDRIYTIRDIINNPEIGRVKLDYFQRCGLAEMYPAIYNLLKKLVEAGYFIYSEICTYSSDFLVSGLIDILAVKGNDFIIIDWKTNRAPIKFEAGYWKKDQWGNLTEYRESNKIFKTPLRELADSVGNHYTLQLSLYDYLTEGFGLNCKGNILCHIRPKTFMKDEPEVEVVTMPIKYLKNDVYKMLNHHNITKNRNREFQMIIGR